MSFMCYGSEKGNKGANEKDSGGKDLQHSTNDWAQRDTENVQRTEDKGMRRSKSEPPAEA